MQDADKIYTGAVNTATFRVLCGLVFVIMEEKERGGSSLDVSVCRVAANGGSFHCQRSKLERAPDMGDAINNCALDRARKYIYLPLLRHKLLEQEKMRCGYT